MSSVILAKVVAALKLASAYTPLVVAVVGILRCSTCTHMGPGPVGTYVVGAGVRH